MDLPRLDGTEQHEADTTATAEHPAREHSPDNGEHPTHDGRPSATDSHASESTNNAATEREETPDTDRRGRPKKAVDQKLRHRLTIRLNDHQQNRLEALATDRDETPSETMRHLIAAEKVDDRAAQLRTVRRELAKIGRQVREKADDWIAEANDREALEARQEQVLKSVYNRLNRLMPDR